METSNLRFLEMDINVYGAIKLDMTGEDLNKMGIEMLDIVTLSFLGKSIDCPVVKDYNYIDNGQSAIAFSMEDRKVSLLASGGLFAQLHGLGYPLKDENGIRWVANDGVPSKVDFKFSLKEKGGYREIYEAYASLFDRRTNNRDDYKDFSDEEFCVFSEVHAGRIRSGRLYRCSSPIHNRFGRNKIADEVAKKYKIDKFVNLSDAKSELGRHMFEYEGTYYSTKPTIFLNMSASYSSIDFERGFLEGLKFIIYNDGSTMIHCIEGKDRTGFVIAVIECLCGASIAEIMKDYFLPYRYYFRVEMDDPVVSIFKGRILEMLEASFGQIPNEYNARDLSIKYLKRIGLSDDEIKILEEKLTK